MREIKYQFYQMVDRRMFNVCMIDFQGRWVYENPNSKHNFNTGYLREFTGLHDKNGKEIYESDLVSRSINKKQYEFEVTYCNGGFKFLERKSLMNMEYGDFWLSDALQPVCHCGEKLWDFEVIGNIYTNPELLEVKK